MENELTNECETPEHERPVQVGDTLIVTGMLCTIAKEARDCKTGWGDHGRGVDADVVAANMRQAEVNDEAKAYIANMANTETKERLKTSKDFDPGYGCFSVIDFHHENTMKIAIGFNL